jgi:hypothetical protein
MRRLPILASLFVLSLCACNKEDPAPLYLEADYQLRCIDCKPTAVDETPRSLNVLNGEAGYVVACSAEASGGDRVVSFSASFKDPLGKKDKFSIAVTQANIDAANPGASCRVEVVEGSNDYKGNCTGGSPTDGKPCVVKLKAEGGVLSGTIDCKTIPNAGDAQIRRYLVAPGTNKAAKFSIDGCTGL